MAMDKQPLEVKGVRVHSSENHKRTVCIDVLIKGGQTVSLDMELPIATRLTDQLIDVEYEERRPADIDSTIPAPEIDQ